jgi:hypothetical protein
VLVKHLWKLGEIDIPGRFFFVGKVTHPGPLSLGLTGTHPGPLSLGLTEDAPPPLPWHLRGTHPRPLSLSRSFRTHMLQAKEGRYVLWGLVARVLPATSPLFYCYSCLYAPPSDTAISHLPSLCHSCNLYTYCLLREGAGVSSPKNHKGRG